LQNTYDKNEGMCVPCKRNRQEHERIEKLAATPGCPACDGAGGMNIDRWEMLEGNQPQIRKYEKYVLLKMELKIGWLFQCAECSAYWYLEHTGNYFTFMKPRYFDYLLQWNEKDLHLTKELTEQVAALLHPHQATDGSLDIVIPCRVQTKDGIWHEQAKLVYPSRAPFDERYAHANFADEVQAVEESAYTLPWEIRDQSSRNMEYAMGFAPNYIEAPDGETLCINGPCTFLEYKEWKGSDFTLSGDQTYRNQGPILKEDRSIIKTFIVDWDIENID
jgi:hypothetical protein